MKGEMQWEVGSMWSKTVVPAGEGGWIVVDSLWRELKSSIAQVMVARSRLVSGGVLPGKISTPLDLMVSLFWEPERWEVGELSGGRST